MKTLRKSNTLAFALVAVVTLIVLVGVAPYVFAGPRLSGVSTALVLVSAGVWVVVLWWALHHLTFQLAALYPVRPSSLPAMSSKPAQFMIFYVTCDDFMEECCRSCVNQDYPAERFQVVICDDGRSNRQRGRIAQFRSTHRGVLHLQRENLSGFKAGNLNHAFRVVAEGKCDWVVIVDADQFLPRHFLQDLSGFVARTPPEVAFVQAGREPLDEETNPLLPVPDAPRSTPFQKALCGEVRLFYERDMFWRKMYGFFPFLGHGGAIRHDAWKAVGGFPELVSEDFGFTMRVRTRGFCGDRIDYLRSWDGYPKDYGAFVVRLCKFASGSVELVRRALIPFTRSAAQWSEKLDATMMMLTYLLIPLIPLNLVITTHICHAASKEGIPTLAPRLPYLFITLFLLGFASLLSVNPSPTRAIRHWFWAFGVYSATVPIASWCVVASLFKNPFFRRTPKGAEASPSFALTSVWSCGFGLSGLALAWLQPSPFSPILASAAFAWSSFPIYLWLHQESTWKGLASRILIYVPGLLFIAGLLEMWLWATS
jgi:cellulose synthase/poly-beta-1,6-N-acetylglucosamine synthase-like glycosyltransferase